MRHAAIATTDRAGTGGATAAGDYEAPDMGDASGLVYVGGGTGDFNGRIYRYDEYADNYGGRHFYFMDGSALKGIRTVSDDMTLDTEILIVDSHVPDSVFDIPEDYEITDMTGGW